MDDAGFYSSQIEGGEDEGRGRGAGTGRGGGASRARTVSSEPTGCWQAWA